ncbi:hypothetical protein [Rosistilla oblonga]|uniref:hypothetical protein n=1 Tax=Rosistilla oblonga TaxID=2527990 RepID=UPI003A96B261
MSERTDADLQAFLDESLPAAQMAEIEAELRDDTDLHQRLATLRGQQDAGLHGLGAIWRRHRVSCLSREELGQFLLGVMDEQAAEYVRFHVQRIGCRYCEANLEDLQGQQREAATQTATRRRKYFQTSVGHLKK